MSCTVNSDKATQASRGSGIPRLANKRAFYLGLAAASAAGLAGALLLARKRIGQALGGWHDRLRGLLRPSPPPGLVDLRQVPEMAARQVIAPTPRDRLTESCVECGSSPRGKPGPWYVIDGKPYCQDCAPRAAGEAGKGLQAPASPRLAQPPLPPSSSSGTRVLVTPPPATGTRIPIRTGAGNADEAQRAAPLDPNRRVETRLHRRRIMVRVSEDRVLYADNAFAVLAPTRNGVADETGLGITPCLVPAANGDIQLDESHWTLTHLATGMKLAGPYDCPAEAQQLASVLAQLDWTPTDPASRFTPQQVDQVRQTIAYYNQALKEAEARIEPDRDDDEAAMTPEEELLYDKVHSTGHAHGFARGYDEGVEAALEELNLPWQDNKVPAGETGEEREAHEEAEKAQLLNLIPADDEEFYAQLYEQAAEEGYDEGYEEGYDNVMTRFGPKGNAS
jgi:hypothetical protein